MRGRGPGPFIALALLIVAGALVWLLLIRDDDGSSEAERADGGVDQPRIVDVEELKQFAGSVGHEVYWLGPKGGAKLELTNTSDGRIYIRYLSSDADAGDPRPEFQTVGTYPVPDAQKALQAAAADGGFTTIPLDGGGIATYNEQQPLSVHFATPESDYEIEVFDPTPQQALELVAGGDVVPID